MHARQMQAMQDDREAVEQQLEAHRLDNSSLKRQLEETCLDNKQLNQLIEKRARDSKTEFSSFLQLLDLEGIVKELVRSLY